MTFQGSLVEYHYYISEFSSKEINPCTDLKEYTEILLCGGTKYGPTVGSRTIL